MYMECHRIILLGADLLGIFIQPFLIVAFLNVANEPKAVFRIVLWCLNSDAGTGTFGKVLQSIWSADDKGGIP